MIRLSQLFKRDSRSDDGLNDSSTRSRTDTKFTGRGSRVTTDDPVLTEDPEHQRARHRLIGAAVLVLVAIIVLPRVLDSRPKTVSNDIAVTIVSSLPAAAAPPQPTSPPSAEQKSDEVKTAIPPIAPTPVTEPKESSKPTPPSPVASSSAKAVAPSPVDKKMGLAAGEEIVVATKPNKLASTTVSPGSSGNFVIQIGAFASEERANGWVTKLKEQKIPNHVLNRTGANGSKLYALRAGPFSDKETAEAAEKKIKAMGLAPRVFEVGKQ